MTKEDEDEEGKLHEKEVEEKLYRNEERRREKPY